MSFVHSNLNSQFSKSTFTNLMTRLRSKNLKLPLRIKLELRKIKKITKRYSMK
jgi:hypothetical protein